MNNPNINQFSKIIALFFEQNYSKNLVNSFQAWLINLGSEINYSIGSNDRNRIVNLQGEAYLAVKKDNNKPFILRTKYLDVKVLGTRFNVSAYPGEELTIVTLNEGLISIQTTDNNNLKLKPNQQLIYNNKTKKTIIKDLNISTTEDASVWTTGKMAFNNESLIMIVKTLERNLDIDIEVDKDVDLNKFYTLKIDRNNNLDEIIEIFKYLDQSLSYKLENNRIHISHN